MSEKYGPFAHPLIPWDEVKFTADETYALGEMARSRLIHRAQPGVYNEFECLRDACKDTKWKSLDATSKCFVCGRFASRTFHYKNPRIYLQVPRTV